MRQPKVEHLCPKCKAKIKKNIGAATRVKYWVCLNPKCGWSDKPHEPKEA